MKNQINFIILIFFILSGCAKKATFYNGSHRMFPKDIVYSGCKLNVDTKWLLDKGISHIDVLSITEPINIPLNSKYILWSGISHEIKDSPWNSKRLPYGNDLKNYRKRWIDRLSFYENRYKLQPTQKNGIIVLDIEAKETPENLNFKIEDASKGFSISDLNNYKSQMASLYFQPLRLLREDFNYYDKVSSYSDVPIERTFWGISELSWEEWQTNNKNYNYVVFKNVKNNEETLFYSNLDFASVSAYYFYSPKFHSKELVNKYLSYLLFQIEINKSWTNKPVYCYLTFRFQGQKEYNDLISKEMVKNSVILTFMAGADGLILHDDLKNELITTEYNGLVDEFTNSIKMLSRYSKYFQKSNKISYFQPENARDLFTNNGIIVRGIISGNKMLVAIINPFADKGVVSKVVLEYNNKKIPIEIIGDELYLNEINL